MVYFFRPLIPPYVHALYRHSSPLYLSANLDCFPRAGSSRPRPLHVGTNVSSPPPSTAPALVNDNSHSLAVRGHDLSKHPHPYETKTANTSVSRVSASIISLGFAHFCPDLLSVLFT